MAAMIPPPPAITTLRAAGLLPDETIEWTPTERIWRIHPVVHSPNCSSPPGHRPPPR